MGREPKVSASSSSVSTEPMLNGMGGEPLRVSSCWCSSTEPMLNDIGGEREKK